jgi:hypothetical protein
VLALLVPLDLLLLNLLCLSLNYQISFSFSLVFHFSPNLFFGDLVKEEMGFVSFYFGFLFFSFLGVFFLFSFFFFFFFFFLTSYCWNHWSLSCFFLCALRIMIVVHQVYNNHTTPIHKGWVPQCMGPTPYEGVLYDCCTLGVQLSLPVL